MLAAETDRRLLLVSNSQFPFVLLIFPFALLIFPFPHRASREPSCSGLLVSVGEKTVRRPTATSGQKSHRSPVQEDSAAYPVAVWLGV